MATHLALLTGVIALVVTFVAIAVVMSGWAEAPSVKRDMARARLFTLMVEVLMGGAIYGSLGALFGYWWPSGRWRWGLWVCLPVIIITGFYPVYIVVVLLRSPSEILSFVAVTLPFAGPVLFACIGAGVASRQSLKRSNG